MFVVDVETGVLYPVEISRIDSTDFKSLNSERCFFDWESEKSYEIYKLCLSVSKKDILGLISLERISDEWRVHIRLLTVSKENKGKEKQYDRITGNLLAYAAKIAAEEYAEMACLSLKPKSQIAKHYIETYGMNITGMTLSLEFPEIVGLINKYDHG